MANTVERKARTKSQPAIQSMPGLGREQYLFGTDAELANRDTDNENPGVHPPPAFKQIVAGDTNKDMNNPSGPTHRGDFKFSSGPNG